MRIMGLDYGAKTIGVALSDALGLTAQPFETIWRKEENKLRRSLARLCAIIEEKEISQIVLGLPRHLNGAQGERVRRTLEFKEKLEKRTSVPILLQDEGLTTFAARDILEESGVKRENQKQVIDQVAAAIILQEFMEENGLGKQDCINRR